MSFKELQKRTTDELREELLTLRQNQLKVKMQKASAQLEQTHQIRKIRRDIARVKTLLRQQEIRV
jgi:ribosomal protein L29